MIKKCFFVAFCLFMACYSLVFYGESGCVVYANQDDCKSYALMDVKSNDILYQKNIDEKLPIASIVKLMTLYLTFEAMSNGYIEEDDVFAISDYASSMGGSQLFLDANTKHMVKDLIKSVVIASANDSAVALAENISGSEKNFVEKMNEKAKELGMNDTCFVDCTGLDESGYSTVRDVLTISKLVLANQQYQKYSNIWLDNYTHPSGRVTELANTNKLLRKYDYCISGKTGTTEKAGYCFTSLSNSNGFELIAVVLGANNTNVRFDIAKELFLQGYANFKQEKIFSSNDFYGELTINGAKCPKVKTYIKDDVCITIKKDEKPNISTSFDMYSFEKIIENGNIVGELNIFNNDKLVAKTLILSEKTIKKANYFDKITQISGKW